MRRVSGVPVWAICCVCLALSCFAPVSSFGQKRKGDLVITSTTLTYDYTKKYAIFQGKVVVQDATMTMTADKMTVYFADQNAIQTIVAVGNVVIKQVGKTATGSKASYSADQDVLVLTGAPAQIVSDSGTATGKKITYWIEEDRVVIDRAKMAIPSSGSVNILGTK